MKLLAVILIFCLSTSVHSGVYQNREYAPEYPPADGGGGGQFAEDLAVPEADTGFSGPVGTEMIGTIDDSTSNDQEEEPETTTKKLRTTTRKESSESSSSSSEEKRHHKQHSKSSTEKEHTSHHLGSELEKFGDSDSTSAEFHRLRKRIKPLFAGTIDTRGNLFTGEEKEKDFKKKFEDESASTEYERAHGKEHGNSDELEDEGHGGHKVHWGSSRSEEEEKHHKSSGKHRRSSYSEEKTKEAEFEGGEGSDGTITSLGEFGDQVDQKKVTSDAVSLIKEVLNP